MFIYNRARSFLAALPRLDQLDLVDPLVTARKGAHVNVIVNAKASGSVTVAVDRGLH